MSNSKQIMDWSLGFHYSLLLKYVRTSYGRHLVPLKSIVDEVQSLREVLLHFLITRIDKVWALQ
jgi:hypothetical protein